MKPPKCDACGRRIRAGHHELRLSDPRTSQLIGLYHAGAGYTECMQSAKRYFVPGMALQATVVHPDRCGDDQEHCDAGAADLGALA